MVGAEEAGSRDDLGAGETWKRILYLIICLWDANKNFQKDGHGSQAPTLYQKLSVLFRILPEDEIIASRELQAPQYINSYCRYFNMSFHTSKLLLIVLFSSVYRTLFCLAKQTVVSSEAGAVSYS